jgi:hypothetical protein
MRKELFWEPGFWLGKGQIHIAAARRGRRVMDRSQAQVECSRAGVEGGRAAGMES